eukprot:gene16310-22498_t
MLSLRTTLPVSLAPTALSPSRARPAVSNVPRHRKVEVACMAGDSNENDDLHEPFYLSYREAFSRYKRLTKNRNLSDLPDSPKVFVILFSATGQGKEGIYSLRTLSGRGGEEPHETIITFESEEDASR